MDADVVAVEKKGFSVLRSISSVNSKVLIAEHDRYGRCVVKYPNPEEVFYRIDSEAGFPLSVAEKVLSGRRNADVHAAAAHLEAVPDVYEQFSLPEFWDAALAALDTDEVVVPSQDERKTYEYGAGSLWEANPQISPGTRIPVQTIKDLCRIPAIVTAYVEGEEIKPTMRRGVTGSSVRDWESSLSKLHELGYAGIFPFGEIDRGNVMRDSAGKLWMYDFGTAVARSEIGVGKYKSICKHDIAEVRRLL